MKKVAEFQQLFAFCLYEALLRNLISHSLIFFFSGANWNSVVINNNRHWIRSSNPETTIFIMSVTLWASLSWTVDGSAYLQSNFWAQNVADYAVENFVILRLSVSWAFSVFQYLCITQIILYAFAYPVIRMAMLVNNIEVPILKLCCDFRSVVLTVIRK